MKSYSFCCLLSLSQRSNNDVVSIVWDVPEAARRTPGYTRQKCTNATRGTNDYIHCFHLIYLYDQHVNPVVARWLEGCTGVFNDASALTELIQQMWSSRVRRGEAIPPYLPSPRMWELFENWLSNWQGLKILPSCDGPGLEWYLLKIQLFWPGCHTGGVR